MTTIVFEPHPDDAVLFATWSILEHQATVITVCGDSHLQNWLGVDSLTRQAEHARAMDALGVDHEMWPIRDDEPDWDAAQAMMEELDERHRFQIDRVFAPAVEWDGNPAHGIVGELAAKVFGTTRVTHYLTYTGSPGAKSRAGARVDPAQEWLPRKHAALACYESQMLVRSGAYRHFLEDLNEYRQTA